MNITIESLKIERLKSNDTQKEKNVYQIAFSFSITIGPNMLGTCDICVNKSTDSIYLEDLPGNNFVYKPNEMITGTSNQRRSTQADENQNILPTDNFNPREIGNIAILAGEIDQGVENQNINNLNSNGISISNLNQNEMGENEVDDNFYFDAPPEGTDNESSIEDALAGSNPSTCFY